MFPPPSVRSLPPRLQPGKPGFAAVRDAVFKVFVYNRERTTANASTELFWTDDDQDLITIASDADLAEAIASANGRPLKLHLGRPVAAASTVSARVATTAVATAAAATKRLSGEIPRTSEHDATAKTVAALKAFSSRTDAPTTGTGGRSPDFRAAMCAEIKAVKARVPATRRSLASLLCAEIRGGVVLGRHTGVAVARRPCHMADRNMADRNTGEGHALLRAIKDHGTRRAVNRAGLLRDIRNGRRGCGAKVEPSPRSDLLRDIKLGAELAKATRNIDPWWWAASKESVARKHFGNLIDRNLVLAARKHLAAAGKAAAAIARARGSTVYPATSASNAARTPTPTPIPGPSAADAREASLRAFRSDLCRSRAGLKKSTTPPSRSLSRACFAESDNPMRYVLMKQLAHHPTACQIRTRATQKHGSVAVVHAVRRSNEAGRIRARARSTAIASASASAAAAAAAAAAARKAKAALPDHVAATARHQAFQRYQVARLMGSIRTAHGSPTGRSADAATSGGWVELSSTQHPPSSTTATTAATAATAQAPASERNVFVKAYMAWA